jgi:hypothetical protein
LGFLLSLSFERLVVLWACHVPDHTAVIIPHKWLSAFGAHGHGPGNAGREWMAGFGSSHK